MKSEYKIKKDRFKSARGGKTHLLELSCRKCGSLVAVYQKDGPGPLLRLYMDRIYFPEKLKGLQTNSLSDIGMLKCDKCGEIIGVPYIYPKENRKAFRLFQDSLVKKITKG